MLIRCSIFILVSVALFAEEPVGVLVEAVDARMGGLLVAEQAGLLRDTGQTLVPVLLQPGEDILAALTAGRAPLAMIGDQVLAAWAAGERPVLLAIFAGPGARQLVVRTESALNDLAGLAAEPSHRQPSWAGGLPLGLRLVTAQARLDPATVFAHHDTTFKAFVAGELSAWPATWRERAALAQQGIAVRPLVTFDQGFSLALVASPEAWRRDAQQLLRCAAAASAGWDLARRDPGHLVEALAASAPAGTPRTALLQEADLALGAIATPLPVTRAALDGLAQLAGESGLAVAVPPGVLATDVEPRSEVGALAAAGPVVPVNGPTHLSWVVFYATGGALLILAGWLARQSRRRAGDARAAATQRSQLPDLPDLEGWELGVHWRPQGEVGGDFYLSARFADGRLLLAVGDVSGHGVGPALVVSAVLKAGELLAPQHASPTGWVLALDRTITPDLSRGAFVTLVAVALDPLSGSCEIVRAGHPPAFLRRAGSTPTWSDLGPVGPAIGLRSTDAAPVVESHHLAPGDELLLFTDGLTEVFDRAGREFGVSGLRITCERHRGKPAQAFVDAIAAEALAHGPRRPEDDVTVLAIRRSHATTPTYAAG